MLRGRGGVGVGHGRLVGVTDSYRIRGGLAEQVGAARGGKSEVELPSGALRPIELAAGAVLGGATVALVTVGSLVPFAAALQLVAAVPMGLLAHRNRFRVQFATTVAATLVTFVAAGLLSAENLVGVAVIGGIIGTVKRRRGGLPVVVVLSGLAGFVMAAMAVGMLQALSRSRHLLFDNLRNTAEGLENLAARQSSLEPVGRWIASFTETVLHWWWAFIGGGIIAAMVVSGIVSWFVLGSVLDRLTWLPGRNDLLDAPIDDRPVAPLPVTLRGVAFRYPGARTDALSGIDLTVAVGEFVAIVGHNGSGKSTLTRLLAGRPATGGTVTRPGAAGLGVRGGTAMVLQRPESQTLGVLVADDVVWGLPTAYAATVDIESLLAEVGLAGMGGRETATLSGGQQQRLAVAAALARQPTLLIADEATSMIDPEGRRDLVALLAALPRRHPMAVILVTHHEADAAAADRVVHLAGGRSVDHLPAWPRPVGDPRRRPMGDPILELRGVGHTYNRGTPWEAPALHDVDLTVRRGEALLIVGGNGSGKSTLAWILAGLTMPTAGSCDLREFTKTRPVHKRIGAVQLAFQHSRLQLQRQTVGEEIEDWGGRGTYAVAKALDAVGLDRALASRSVEELSGGQAKRVVLAAIVASHPQVVVLDEPLAGLDPEGRAGVVDLLARLRDSGLTLIVISHDVADTATVCDRIVQLRDGRIVEGDAAPARFPSHDFSGGVR
ncbi:ATP-binding cassette domain-containing protein [Nocardia seriolae]|nr:ATP-binding cassette domain-containing protein [Nocardia seriolae]MTJ70282.1 ATP-binding cassette domain-containing protein [Nocardia seriolae]MTJ91076.1 ATP-binding cassette domain-containing protein [Nocardia seriolae]MTK35038.1 ATP-binding cassette domain-containing protein [Nocardia seriolae]MTK38768.1 ATP-binding cassette domain-containing protein [Nocardia seriolae]